MRLEAGSRERERPPQGSVEAGSLWLGRREEGGKEVGMDRGKEVGGKEGRRESDGRKKD